MDKNLIRLMELQILQSMEEEASEEVEQASTEQVSGIGLYRVKAPVGEYNSIMSNLRGLVWPKSQQPKI